MKKIFLFICLMLTILNAQTEPKTSQEMMELLAQCLLENAPDNWQVVSVNYKRLDKNKDGLDQISVTHSVIVGAPDASPQRLEPCRPLIPTQLVEMLSETLPQGSQQWKEVSISIDKSGRFKANYVQP
jgi:hypothetical protein